MDTLLLQTAILNTWNDTIEENARPQPRRLKDRCMFMRSAAKAYPKKPDTQRESAEIFRLVDFVALGPCSAIHMGVDSLGRG